MTTVTGFCPLEGQDINLERIFNNIDTNRIKLFAALITDANGFDTSTVYADITEPTESVPIQLTDGNWVITANGAGLGFTGSYPEITFTGPFTENITGVVIYAENAAGTVQTLLYVTYSGTSDTVGAGVNYYFTPHIKHDKGVDAQLCDDGSQDMLELCLNNTDLNNNRGTNLYWDLYTNASGLSGSSSLTDMTEPTGTYSGRIAATDGTWTVLNGKALSPAVASWTASGGDFTGDIIGAFLASNGTSRRLYFYDEYINSPVSVVSGETYQYDATTST